MFATRRPMTERLAGCALWLAALGLPVMAVAQYRPSGPVTITADEVDWQDDQDMEYRGNVALESDGFRLSGERLRLERRAAGIYVELDGDPARMEQDALRDQGPVSAEAQQLVYDAATQWIDLTDEAQLVRGKDRIDGRSIRYNVTERRVQARREGDDRQVRIIIDNDSLPTADKAGEAPTP